MSAELAEPFNIAAWIGQVHAAAADHFNDDSLENPVWKPLAAALLAATADDFATIGEQGIQCMFDVLGHCVDAGHMTVSRKAKRVERYAIKFAQGDRKADVPFKCISDLVAFSVLVNDAKQIRSVAAKVVQLFIDAGGRAFTSTRYPPSLSDRVYVLMPGCAIAEVAVQHPFARHVFANDSARRDAKDGILDATWGSDEPINYWADGVWDAVSSALMAGDTDAAIEILTAHQLAVPPFMRAWTCTTVGSVMCRPGK